MATIDQKAINVKLMSSIKSFEGEDSLGVHGRNGGPIFIKLSLHYRNYIGMEAIPSGHAVLVRLESWKTRSRGLME